MMNAKLSKAWIRQAGVYTKAADVVRAADYNPNVSDEAYGALIATREAAMLELQAISAADKGTV